MGSVFQSLSDRPICQHAQILSLCLLFAVVIACTEAKKCKQGWKLEANSALGGRRVWKGLTASEKKCKAKCEEKHEENAGCDFWTWTKPTPVIRHKLRRQCRLFKGKTKPSRQNFNYSVLGTIDCNLLEDATHNFLLKAMDFIE